MTGLCDVMFSELSQSLNRPERTDSTSSFCKKSGINSDTDGVYFGELKLLSGGGLKTGGEPSFEMRGAGSDFVEFISSFFFYKEC